MLSLEWEGNLIEVSEPSARKVTEQLMSSHIHMVRGAIRVTKQPMVVWVSGLNLDLFKASPGVAKEVSARQDENGRALDRGLSFHSYCGRHFALSMAMQAVDVSPHSVFQMGGGLYWMMLNLWDTKRLAILAYPDAGSNPTILGAPTDAERFQRGGIPSMSTFQ